MTAAAPARTRRALLTTGGVLVLVAVLVWTGLPGSRPAPSPAPPGAGAADPSGMLWGAYPNPRVDETRWDALDRGRASAGRELAAVRRFYLWDDDREFPTSLDRDLLARGTTLVVAVKPERRAGGGVPWSDVADAGPGSRTLARMRSWAGRLRDLDVPVYVTFNHEPEARANQQRGTAEEYVAAWRRWVGVLRSEGADNVRHLWIMTDYSFVVPDSDRRSAPRWYPGDEWVDGIGADSYNWFECRPGILTPWRSLEEIIAPQREFWLEHSDKELWLTEYGSVEDPAVPGRKAAWFDEARALFKTEAYAVYDGVVLFEDEPGYPCDWRPNTSASAERAWSAWGNDPYYAADLTGEGPAGGARVAVVTGDPQEIGDDAALVARLRAQDYRVTLHDDDAAASVTLVDPDVVLVTQEVSQDRLGDGSRVLADLDRPVVTWKPSVYDDLGLTHDGADGSDGATVRTDRVELTSVGGAVTRGLPASVALSTAPSYLPVGSPGTAAVVAATADGQPSLFVYQAGDEMVGRIAAGCRLALPLPDAGVGALTDDGLALLDRVVRYASEGC